MAAFTSDSIADFKTCSSPGSGSIGHMAIQAKIGCFRTLDFHVARDLFGSRLEQNGVGFGVLILAGPDEVFVLIDIRPGPRPDASVTITGGARTGACVGPFNVLLSRLA